MQRTKPFTMECDLFDMFINDDEEIRIEKPIKLEEIQQHRNPFEYMHIDDNSFLTDLDGRSPCSQCHKSRKFFCYTCYLPTKVVAQLLPVVKLPLKIDIIKHKKEIDGKSTAIHAAILAPADVSIYTYPDIPDYETEQETTVLIFPSQDCINVRGIFDNHVKLDKTGGCSTSRGFNEGTLLKYRLGEINGGYSENDSHEPEQSQRKKRCSLSDLPIKRAVFIDSTWNQSRSVYKDPRVNKLQAVVIQNRLSQFWRHQKNCPRWYLATIEAIHQFLLEVHINAWGLNKSYRGLDALDVDMAFFNQRIIDEENEDGTRGFDSAVDELSKPYNGQYDNLLFFFTHMYKLIHTYYDHNDLKAYKRPI